MKPPGSSSMLITVNSSDTGSPTSVQSKVLLMSEAAEKEQAQSKTKTVTIYRRCSSRNASDPSLFDGQDDEAGMKMPPLNQPSRVSSHPLPPRCISAAEAEQETIFCLKRECKALKMAMRALPKHSKEWTLMNAKLEIANEELQATLEDINMTQNYSNNSTETGGGGVGNIPTPPLSSPFCQTPVKSFNRQSGSYGSDTDSSMEINELFATLKPPLLYTGANVNVDVEALKQDLDKAEKFSLEYFKIKKKIDRAEKRSSSLSPSPVSSENSARSLQHLGSLESSESIDPTDDSLKSFDEVSDAQHDAIPEPTALQFSSPESNTSSSSTQQQPTISSEDNKPAAPSQQQLIKVGNGLGNLRELLDVVPKYSLEWFNLKKDIKTASGGQTPQTPKLSKYGSSFSLGGHESVQQSQMKRLDSLEVNSYPIPHVSKPETDSRKTLNRKRAKSRETARRRRKSQDETQDLDSLDAQYFYVRMRRNVVTVQNLWRMRDARLNFSRMKLAALCIQSTFRMSLRRDLYRQVIHGVIFIQSRWRGHVQRVHLRIVASPFVHEHPAHHAHVIEHSETDAAAALKSTPSEDEEDFFRIQRSIEAMKNEKMSMEMKLLQLKNDIDVIKNEKLRRDLDRMRHDIESLEHLNEDILFDNDGMSSGMSVYSYDQTLDSVPTNVFSVVLGQKGSLGIEMEHHKSSDSVRIAHVKKKSQADKAGLHKGDIVVNFRSQQHPDGMPYAQFIALAKQGVRPLVLDITRVNPSVVGSSRRSGLLRKIKKHR